jgi:hypothetical protein
MHRLLQAHSAFYRLCRAIALTLANHGATFSLPAFPAGAKCVIRVGLMPENSKICPLIFGWIHNKQQKTPPKRGLDRS